MYKVTLKRLKRLYCAQLVFSSLMYMYNSVTKGLLFGHGVFLTEARLCLFAFTKSGLFLQFRLSTVLERGSLTLSLSQVELTAPARSSATPQHTQRKKRKKKIDAITISIYQLKYSRNDCSTDPFLQRLGVEKLGLTLVN